MRALAVALTIACAAPAAWAEPPVPSPAPAPAPASAPAAPVVSEGDAAWRYQLLELPAPPVDDPLARATVLGASTVSSIATTAAGQGRSPDWTRADAPDADWAVGQAPFGAADPAKCECQTHVGSAPALRVAALRLRRHFDVPRGELAGLRALAIHARWQDGMVVYLNGVLVAERQLKPDGAVDAQADALHGPEWETWAFPVLPWLLKPTGNVLAVEVRPNLDASDRPVWFDLSLSAATGPRLSIGPYLQIATPGRAVIVVETDLPSVAEASYGKTADYGGVVRSGEPRRHHELVLAGLDPGAPVHYRVRLAATAEALAAGSGVLDTGDALITAPPGPGEPVRFAVYGDSRGGHDTHTRIISALEQAGVDFVVTTGDVVRRGHDESEWQKFFALVDGLARSVPFYPAIGNHDVGTAAAGVARFRQLFPASAPPDEAMGSYYSLDLADLHLVFLDSNRYESTKQLAWLEHDLAGAAARHARAIFAVTHDGPVSRGDHGGNADALAHYVPLLQKYNAAAIFSGHDHDYERGFVPGPGGKPSKLAYVVSGGGGAPLYDSHCGKPGQAACHDTAKTYASEHHYVLVEVLRDFYRLCTHRVDGTPLEKCVTIDLPGKKRMAKKSTP